MKEFNIWKTQNMKSFEIFLAEVNSEFQALGGACLSRPHDSLPWLAAADWCADRGETETEQYLRSSAILVEHGPDELEQACELVEAENTPKGRRALAIQYGNHIPWFAGWVAKREDMIPCMTSGIVEEELPDHLPQGSGIDLTWDIDAGTDHFVCRNGFHAMDDYGGYAGWIHFGVQIPYRTPLDFQIEINEGDVARLEERDVFVGDMSEYLYEMVREKLRRYVES